MGPNVVVSGGGTGIGKAIVARFVAEGSNVLIVGRRQDVLEAVVEDLAARGGSGTLHWCAADLSRASDAERVAAEVGTVDVVVNNAGGAVSRGLRHEGLIAVERAWQADYAANVVTAVLLTEALRPKLRRPGGRVITISSIAALRGGGDSYSAAKAALLGWTYSLAGDLGPEGITVNAVAPGYIAGTEFFGDTMTDDRRRHLVAQTRVGRAGTPEDVAGAVA